MCKQSQLRSWMSSMPVSLRRAIDITFGCAIALIDTLVHRHRSNT